MATTLLSLADVARNLGVSKQRILVLSRAGRIRGAVKVSGCWIYRHPLHVTPPTRGRFFKIKSA